MISRVNTLVAAVGSLLIGAVAAPNAVAADCTSNYAICHKKSVAAQKAAAEAAKAAAAAATSKNEGGQGTPAAVIEDPYRYKLTLACGARRMSTPDEADQGDCRYALIGCQYRKPPSDEALYYVWRQLKTGGDWLPAGDSCGTRDAPPAAVAPPPVPTFGQIQEAFAALPFAQPSVNIQPEGDVTLVNLPTYFEAQWPAVGLEPGEVSKKVQLLSWSIEFKIAPATYNYDFGDGSFSGATQDSGGPYPEGQIRHTFEQPIPAAQVKVDAELTGWYRVNGGAWEPIDTVADLQDEPVVTLQVREAKARLYNN